MELFEDAAAAVVDALGEPAVYFDGEQTIEVTVVRSSGFRRVDGNRGPAVASRRAEANITKAAVAEPKHGDLLFLGTLADFVGVFDYEVVSVRPDDEDVSFALVLKLAEQP